MAIVSNINVYIALVLLNLGKDAGNAFRLSRRMTLIAGSELKRSKHFSE
jgi:hypothetical protein